MRKLLIQYHASIYPILLLVSFSLAAQEEKQDFEGGSLFDEVTAIVQKQFYDAEFDFGSWLEESKQLRERAVQAANHDEFDRIMNQLLNTLDTSHTYYYSKRNPRHFQLFGVFHEAFPKLDAAKICVYEGIGLDYQFLPAEQKYRVISVYEGLPAEEAGLKFGDVILSVAGKPFHPIDSFTGKSDNQVQATVKRKSQELQYQVQIERLDGRDVFEKTLQASIKSFHIDNKQIGYAHLRSYAGAKYHELLRTALLFGELSNCDGLVLDLRDGWGGADLNYLNLFRDPIASVESRSRNGKTGRFTGVWEKPVTLITNRRSTSGKELFAYGFKKLQLGKIVGEKTAGAVVAGRCFPLSNGDALYLAVADVLVDGKRLEGVGVEPDIEVSRTSTCPIDAPTQDPQINAAIQQCLSDIRGTKTKKRQPE